MRMPAEGSQLKTRATCELQEKGLLFRGFSSFMSLNVDHVQLHPNYPVLLSDDWAKHCRAG